ncbi:MAG: hypothetical protein IJS92_00285 [Paludibacteraceae bacterium]|nr:hypothetical protein [Paludibacteraceae bacterium]
MKKSIIFAFFVMLTMSMSAQHVAPLNIHLTEFNLDTLRSIYQGQSYLLELQRLDKLLKDDTKVLKEAKEQLKTEKEYYKNMSGYVTKAEASFKNLQTLSQKELDEFKKLKDNSEKQLRTVNAATQLSTEIRNKAVDHLQEQRRALDAAINATTSRQTQLANQPVQLQQIRTDLMVLNNELTNKETDIKQLEATLKQRRDIIKAETKNVKAQK